MDLWILYAITSWVFFWISSFISKITAHNNFNKTKVILFWKLSSLILAGVYFFINYKYVEITLLILFLMIVRIIAATEKHLFIIKSLKNIESSLFFPIHKIIQIFASFLVWMFIFNEYLWAIEYLIVFLWILMILLLSDKENKKIQINYKKWIIYLLITNLFLIFSSSINKYIWFIDFDIATYMFYSLIFWIIYIFSKKEIYKKSQKKISKNEIIYWIIRWILIFFSFFLLLLSLQTWPFVFVSIITSIGIFIPIILSMIFYKEKINKNKILAFILLLVIIVLLTYK